MGKEVTDNKRLERLARYFVRKWLLTSKFYSWDMESSADDVAKQFRRCLQADIQLFKDGKHAELGRKI